MEILSRLNRRLVCDGVVMGRHLVLDSFLVSGNVKRDNEDFFVLASAFVSKQHV